MKSALLPMAMRCSNKLQVVLMYRDPMSHNYQEKQHWEDFSNPQTVFFCFVFLSNTEQNTYYFQ